MPDLKSIKKRMVKMEGMVGKEKKPTFKDGAKALVSNVKSRIKIKKNIRSMANSAAMTELKGTKDLNPSQRGANKAQNRATAAYKATKKFLKKQIKVKY